LSESTVTKAKVFKEDIALATGGTSADEEGVRVTSTGGEVTLTKVDASHIKFRTLAKSIDDLVDGGQDIELKPSSITMDGTLTNEAMTSAGFVKNTAAGVLSGGNSLAASDLPTAINAANIANGSVTNAEFQYLGDVTSLIQAQLDALTVLAEIPYRPYAILQNRQTQNTAGGTATSGSWQIIPFNVEYEDTNGILDSGSLPAFSLAAGTYRIEATFPFGSVHYALTRLYNVTDAAVQVNVASLDINGTSQYNDADGPITAKLLGTFTITDTKQFRIEYRVTTTIATYGLGWATNWGTEVYAQACITKTA